MRQNGKKHVVISIYSGRVPILTSYSSEGSCAGCPCVNCLVWVVLWEVVPIHLLPDPGLSLVHWDQDTATDAHECWPLAMFPKPVKGRAANAEGLAKLLDRVGP